MFNRSNNPAKPENYFLKRGYIFVPRRPTIISAVLGSCIAVCLFDTKHKIGGMNHFLYPQAPERRQATAQYGNAATLMLVRMMVENGSRRKHLQAQIFGGAHNPGVSSHNIGRENIQAARNVLSRRRIQLVSEDVGGRIGRKIVFDTRSNEIAVLKVEKLRQSDWYPYEGER